MQSNSIYSKSFLLLLTLFFLLILSINVFSESARLYNPTNGTFVNYGWYGFWFQRYTTPNNAGDKNFLIDFNESWDYNAFRDYSLDKIFDLNGDHFYRCDSKDINYTEFNVDVLAGETIVASYDQFKVVSGTGYPDNLFCSKPNSSLPDYAMGGPTWPSLTFTALGQADTNIYAQPNNFSNDYDCDVNKFWIAFVKPNGNIAEKFICDDNLTKLDTCVKSFTADVNGVWKVRFGDGIVYEAIHCNGSDNNLSPDYNTFWFERKWGINNWDINVIKPSETEPSLGRVWMGRWGAASFINKDVNFFVLASAIGNASNCNWDSALFGQGNWSNCYSEYFQLRLKEFSLGWSSINTNENGLNVYPRNNKPSPTFSAFYTQKSLPHAAKINDTVLATSKTFRQILNEMGLESYTGCGDEEYYFFDTRTTTGLNDIGPFVNSPINQRLYFNEPAFSKKPGDYTPSVKVTEKINSYVFDLNVGQNVSKYYQIFIDLDKDGDFFEITDFYSDINKVHGSGQYIWDLKNNSGDKFPSGDYNYLFRFFSTITNVPVAGLSTRIWMELSRPIGGILTPDKLYWDDTKVGGQLNVVGQNIRDWDGTVVSGDSCIDHRTNCLCLNRANGTITAFYDLNQSRGMHDAMNTWAYGDVTEYKGNVRVIIIENQLLNFDVSVVDENTLRINVDCTFDTTLSPSDLNRLVDGSGNVVPLTFIPPLDCNAGGSEIIAKTETPLLQNEVYSIIGGLADSGSQVFFTFDDKDKPKANIPDNNIFTAIFLFVLVLIIVTRKRK